MKLVSSKEEFDEIILNNKIVVVDFYATWCGPCNILTPMLNVLEEEYTKEKIYFVKIDVDNEEFTNLLKDYSITCMPTIIYFIDGKFNEKYTVKGANISQIKFNINKLIQDRTSNFQIITHKNELKNLLEIIKKLFIYLFNIINGLLKIKSRIRIFNK